MRREIKFRGKRTVTGRFVYGNLLFDFGVTYVGGWEVDPESVAQLVGRDKNGREIYEGDKLAYAGKVMTAELLRVPAGDNYLLEATT